MTQHFKLNSQLNMHSYTSQADLYDILELAGTSANLTVHRGFPQILQSNAEILLPIGHDFFLSNPFQFMTREHAVASVFG
jgi:hypothetical protein